MFSCRCLLFLLILVTENLLDKHISRKLMRIIKTKCKQQTSFLEAIFQSLNLKDLLMHPQSNPSCPVTHVKVLHCPVFSFCEHYCSLSFTGVQKPTKHKPSSIDRYSILWCTVLFLFVCFLAYFNLLHVVGQVLFKACFFYLKCWV